MEVVDELSLSQTSDQCCYCRAVCLNPCVTKSSPCRYCDPFTSPCRPLDAKSVKAPSPHIGMVIQRIKCQLVSFLSIDREYG
ncbi:hypothetical protein TNCV_128441 [Trichonephila clavipes]|nr:hypothetical protein TNCV_128441 [Trichonephila clavipes]